MAKPKLLIISPARAVGGGEVNIINILPELKQNYELTVLATSAVRKLLEKNEVELKRFILFPRIIEKYLNRDYRLKKIYYGILFRLFFAGKSYDLISLQLFDGAIVESIDARPLTLSVQTRFPIPREHDNYIRTVLERIDKVICVSEQTKKDLTDRGVASAKCIVVHNGLPIKKYNLSPHPGKYITWVGRVEKEDKNPMLFVKIAQLAQERNLDMRFRIVGTGGYLKVIKNYIASNNIDNVELYGFCPPDAMRNIYADANLLCMTSTSEGLPLVAIEAMASGVPVVASDAGGLRELIPARGYGILVNSLAANEFLSEIEKLLNDKKRYESIRYAARKRVEEHFSIKITAQKTKVIYDSLLEQR